MALKLNPTDSFRKEFAEFENQVFQSLKWTFYFVKPLLMQVKNAARFYAECLSDIFRNK